MAGTIEHYWDGTTLIVKSDSGTSACDLKGEQGAMGVRGAQGIPGIGVGGKAGKDGYTPVYGVDYWTPEDKQEIIDEANVLIKTELAKKTQLQPTFASTVEECTDTSKLYVLPDGYIYAFMKAEIIDIPYINRAEPLPNNTTDTTKWVNGYRYSSSGDPSAEAGTTVSNMIPIYANGGTLRIKGATLRESKDRIALFITKSDGSQTSLRGYFNVGITNSSGNVTYNGFENDTYTFTITKGTDTSVTLTGIRFAMATPTDADAVIITVNQEIKEPTTVIDYAWTNTYISFIPNDYEEDFVEVKNDIVDLKVDNATTKGMARGNLKLIEELQNKIEKIGATEIPEYWQEHIETKITTIKNLHKQFGKDCFSFIFMTDIHYPSNLGKLSPKLARKISDECSIKYVLCGGDTQTRGCYNTKEEVVAENLLIDEFFKPISDRLLRIEGNHDGSYGKVDKDGNGLWENTGKPVEDYETYIHNLTPQELHEHIYRKVGAVGNVRFDETGTAYYIDDIANNVRYIGLNTQYNKYELKADETQKYPKMWLFHFGQKQFDFLINEALVDGMRNNTEVVIFAHCPITISIRDREVMVGVLNAFKNKTTYNGKYAGEFGYDAVSVSVDFTNAKGNLVGYFSGHNHVDSIENTSGITVVGTRSDAKQENTDDLKAERIEGTITEQSFDVFTVNPTNRTIYATKIGAGADRIINY